MDAENECAIYNLILPIPDTNTFYFLWGNLNSQKEAKHKTFWVQFKAKLNLYNGMQEEPFCMHDGIWELFGDG